MLRAVLFHRLLQSTTMRKKVDVYSDTIKNVRDRNNQRYLFEKSLEVLAEGLLRQSTKQANSETANAASVSLNFEKQNAPRYSERTPTKGTGRSTLSLAQ